MQIGMIGLGRMGSNMVRRLDARRPFTGRLRPSSNAVNTLVTEGATGATSLADFAGPALDAARALCDGSSRGR